MPVYKFSNAGGFTSKQRYTSMTAGSIPAIITSNMTLYLDAANTTSYSGSGTTWSDISGRGNNFSMVNSPTWNSSGYFSFNGTNQGFNGTSSDFAWGTGSITVEMWIYINSLSNYETLFSTRPDNGGYTDSLDFATDATGNQIVYSNAFLINTSGTLSAGVWMQVGYTRSSGVYSTFRNGSVNGTSSSTNVNCTRTLAGIGNLPSAAGVEPFNGRVAIVRVYSAALSSSQIQTNFDANKGRFGI